MSTHHDGDHYLRPLDGSTPAEHYQRFGWWVSDIIVPPDALRRVRSLCDQLDTAERDGPFPDVLREFLAWDGSLPRPPRLNQYFALQYQAVYDLVMTPRIHEIAAELSGARTLRIFNTAMIRKSPGDHSRYATVGVHCDAAYWRTCSSRQMLTAWVPLQDTSVDMGPIRYYSASHRWPDHPEVRALRDEQNFTATGQERMRRWLAASGIHDDPVTGAIRAGQVTFHHCLTLHGSGANTSARTRDGISIHLQPGDNRYEQRSATDEYVHDAFVRRRDGVPDYTDARLCPLTWPVAARGAG
ncbi:phytanoyl-CoA dioxygenase family protein [Actinophytocola glycyrrhizae]|uniref:Phytanoyl-CoA dioxygenase family protein n=1 Tax=Actinophytocola glycyrrhizae TaxID=2044873 RepID=A0ABV9SBY3_9PSEU